MFTFKYMVRYETHIILERAITGNILKRSIFLKKIGSKEIFYEFKPSKVVSVMLIFSL